MVALVSIATLAIALGIPAAFTAQAETRGFDQSGFSAVRVNSGLEMVVEVGPAFSITAEGEREAIDTVDIYLEGTMLVAVRKHDWRETLFSWSSDNRQVTLNVTLPRLDAVAADAGAHVEVSGLLETVLQAEASAGAAIALVGIQGASVALAASGGASIVARGTCSEIVVQASGGASVNAGGLDCAASTAEASGGASVSVSASEAHVLQASSGASLTAKGGGRIAQQEARSGANISVRP